MDHIYALLTFSDLSTQVFSLKRPRSPIIEAESSMPSPNNFLRLPPLGIQLRFKDKRVVVEITPRDESQRNILSTDGLILDNKTIIGTPALRNGSGFLVVNLYDLPHLSEQQLIPAIQQMLQPYGRILDISLFFCCLHHIYFSWVKGCVLLDVTNSDHSLSTHTLNFPGIDHEVRAFWKGSPPYCRICHDDTHEKDACPKVKARHVQACTSCGGYGHFHSPSCSQSH